MADPVQSANLQET